jgi:exopolysaccharide production protein ExoQ
MCSLLLFWWGTQRVRSPGFNRVLPLAAAGLLAISVLWSVAPSTTMTRSVAYLFVIVGAIGIAELLDPGDVMRLTALIGGFLAAASLLLFFIHPAWVIVEGEDFRGLFPHKNQLGQAMTVGVLAGLHGIRVRGRGRVRSIGVVVLCSILAFMSKSTTSLLTIAAFFSLHLIGTLYVKGGGARIMSIFLTIVAATTFVLVMVNADLIFALLDKDPNLTGRTELWPYVIDAIYEKPILGWGFTAFWIPSNPRAVEISSVLGWGGYVAEAHNGMLQLLLDVGVVGTAFFLFLWARNLVVAVKCINGPAPEIGVTALLLLVGILLIGVSEQVLATVDPVTTQFFLLGFMCERQLWLARRARRGVILRSNRPPVGQFEAPGRENAVRRIY